MGIRGYEGFGFVSVNPKWIRCIEEKRNGEAIFSLRFDLKVGKASAHKVLPMDLDTIGTTQIAIDRANTIEQGRLKAELGDVRQWITAVAREKNLNQLLALDRILPSTLQLRAQSLGSNQEQNREAALRYFRAFETCLQKRVDESSIPSPATPIPSQEAE
jgi:hypothetical protein